MTNATTPTTTPKSRPVFYTKPTSKVAIALWLNTVATPRAPMFTGKIGDVSVGGFVRTGENGTFIDLVGDKQENGFSLPVARANMIANKFGIPKLAVKLAGSTDTTWVEVSLSLPLETQVACGLDTTILEEKKAAAAAAKAAKEVAPA